ncbi:MAG: glutathione peroxidase [Erysipelothrix sp.]|nr:glutathione peroxidase [Erysipelothrix sp.]
MITFKSATNEEFNLDQFKGKVCLIFNSATGCGLAPQFANIQSLFETYREQGFEVLDFPSNTFKQSLESAQEASSICQLKFQTTFTTYEKIEVNGENTHPLFVFLKDKGKATGIYGVKNKINQDIEWNFTKFLLNKNQTKVLRFGPQTSPDQLASSIEKFLKEKA